MNIVTFTEFRSQLKQIMDTASDQHEPVIIKRSKGENMILLSNSDYEALKETAYLLSNKANAEHLRKSLDSLRDGKLIVKNLLEE
ncbi:MAG: relB [Gammaproteobacteria bacterium]|jgi:antitoxin YefM|nr:relB [Gammaproteobacteria bacterium]